MHNCLQNGSIINQSSIINSPHFPICRASVVIALNTLDSVAHDPSPAQRCLWSTKVWTVHLNSGVSLISFFLRAFYPHNDVDDLTAHNDDVGNVSSSTKDTYVRAAYVHVCASCECVVRSVSHRRIARILASKCHARILCT